MIHHLEWMPPQADFLYEDKHSSKLFNMIVLCLCLNVGIVTAASHLTSLYHARSGQTLNIKSHVRRLEFYDDA